MSENETEEKALGYHKLQCGHYGHIIWKKDRTIAVKGIKKGRSYCIKYDKNGEMNPNIYLIKYAKGEFMP